MIIPLILSRLGVPLVKTSSTAIAAWSRIFIEDKLIEFELAPGVNAEITLDFDNQKAEDTFLFAFLINGALTAWSLKNLPEAVRVFRASQAAYTTARLSGATRGEALISSRAAGRGVGFVLGKVLLVDTIIWVGSMSIDGVLNFFLEEEDQGVFSDMYGGWSPLGEAFTWIIESIWGSEEAEDPIAEMFQIASDEPTLAAAIGVAIEFFMENKPQVEIEIEGEALVHARTEAYIEGIQESFNRPAEEVWIDWINLSTQIVIAAIGIRFAYNLARTLIQVGTEG